MTVSGQRQSLRDTAVLTYNRFMRAQGSTHYNFWLLNAAAYVTLGAVALGSLSRFAAGLPRLLAGGGFLLFALLIGFFLSLENRPRLIHAYLAAQSLIIIGLSFLEPAASDNLQILFFVLSAQSMLFLPIRTAVFWIVAFSIISISGYMILFDITEHLGMLTVIGGFLFFGTFGAALRQSNQARQESQRLLAELRAANDQLRAYTRQAEQLAVSEERNRLAREMHDALGHRLTVAVVQLEGAQRLIPQDPTRAGEIVGRMRAQLKQALAELRQTITTLRQPELEPVPADTAAALTQLVYTFQEATGLPVHLTLPAELPPLPDAHRHAIFRAAQESLTNVQRHAAADNAWLEISLAPQEIILTVADDGHGFTDEASDGRFGLVGLRERAETLHGRLTLDRAPQGGAAVRFTLPLPAPVRETAV